MRLARRAGWREEGGADLTTPSRSLIHLEEEGGADRVCVCVCVCVGGGKECDRLREREGI